MSSLWHPHVKEAPLQGLTGLWGGVGSNLVGGISAIEQGTISELYNAGNPPGIQKVVLNDGSSLRQLNFTTYNSKGWVEIMYAGNTGWGWQTSSNFYGTVGGGYGLKDLNTSGSGNTLGLDYNNPGAQIMLGTNITFTDVLFTSKSSRSLAQINPATGENQNSALPLVVSASLGGAGTQQTATKTAFKEYFKGTRQGFSFYQGGSEATNAFSSYWDKGGLSFGATIHSRSDSNELDHWMIASGQDNSGSTYHANIGFRGTQSTSSYASRFVGAWVSGTDSKGSQYYMANDNVFSVWATDM